MKDCKHPEKRIHVSDMLFFVALRSIFLCSCSIHLKLQVIKKNPNLTYLCTCFNTSQYLVSLNTLQQTIRKTLKQNRISKTVHRGFCITKNKMVGFCCWYFVWGFFPPEMLELSSDLWVLILKKLQCSAWLFITYQQASHTCVHKFSYHTHMILLSTIT